MPVLNFTPQSFVHIHICVCICIYMCIMHMRRNTIFTQQDIYTNKQQTNEHTYTQYTYIQTHFCNQRHEGRTEMIYFIQSNLSSVLNSVRRNVHFFRTIDTFQRLVQSDDRSEQRSSRIRHLRDHGKINRIYYLKKIFCRQKNRYKYNKEIKSKDIYEDKYKQ